MNGENGYKKRWSCPRGSDAEKAFTLKEYSKIFYDIESEKDKIFEVDPCLEKWYGNLLSIKMTHTLL